MALALEECASNVVNHGLHRDAHLPFEVTLACDAGTFAIELRDRGPEFDPTVATVPEDDLEREGGWGIALVRRYLDEINYRRLDGENILRLVRRLSPPGQVSTLSQSQTPHQD
jgi:serine/threonine-protein kinase RsbW